jgi:hypothetical protein
MATNNMGVVSANNVSIDVLDDDVKKTPTPVNEQVLIEKLGELFDMFYDKNNFNKDDNNNKYLINTKRKESWNAHLFKTYMPGKERVDSGNIIQRMKELIIGLCRQGKYCKNLNFNTVHPTHDEIRNASFLSKHLIDMQKLMNKNAWINRSGLRHIIGDTIKNKNALFNFIIYDMLSSVYDLNLKKPEPQTNIQYPTSSLLGGRQKRRPSSTRCRIRRPSSTRCRIRRPSSTRRLRRK